jgi:2-amino-4-hydroxy-6-hydroxymethyldihydropteridine diphosphokinase
MLAAIALGSNLPSRFGTPTENLNEALHRLAGLGQVTAVSTFRRTIPVGRLDQPDFINAAALLETDLAPLDLLSELLAIEHAMGRDRACVQPKGPRVIDLDLLLYENEDGSTVMKDPTLTLPHPSMHDRRFVLDPLAEIAPDMQHPILRHSVRELLWTVQS